MTTIEDICDRMDNLMLHSLELMEEKISVTLQLENQIKEGHIEMAKARYIRGKESIGLIQVPQDTTISSLFDLELSFPEQGDSCNEANVMPQFDIHMKSKEEASENQDPVRWFGVLVPQSLKTSQKRFQECLYLAVKLANVSAKLYHVQKNFQEQQKLKNKLLNNSEE